MRINTDNTHKSSVVSRRVLSKIFMESEIQNHTFWVSYVINYNNLKQFTVLCVAMYQVRIQ